jgi:hypothetical protein
MKTSITSALVLGTVLSLSGVALANTASPSTHRISAADPAPSKEKHAKKDAKDKDKAPAKHDAKHSKDAKPGEAH